MSQTICKKMFKWLTFLSFGLSALFVILARIYTVFCSNVTIMYTAWPEVLEILVNVLECSIYGISFAFIIYAAYRFLESGSFRFVAVYAGSVLFKYIANYVVTWITDTGMSMEYLIENLTYVLIYAAIELAQAALVIWMIYRTMNHYHEFIKGQMKIAATLPGAEISVRTYVFPFSSLISWRNPLQKCALWSGIVISAFKIISRLIYDVNFGWPSSVVDALWMLIYYLLDLVVGLAVCLLITYLLMRFDSAEKSKL